MFLSAQRCRDHDDMECRRESAAPHKRMVRNLHENLSCDWAGILSLALVSVKLFLKAGLGVFDRQQCEQWSLECLTANVADSDCWNSSKVFY